jgi:hypothetical protein
VELGGSFDLKANFKNKLTVSKLHMCKVAIKFGARPPPTPPGWDSLLMATALATSCRDSL